MKQDKYKVGKIYYAKSKRQYLCNPYTFTVFPVVRGDDLICTKIDYKSELIYLLAGTDRIVQIPFGQFDDTFSSRVIT